MNSPFQMILWLAAQFIQAGVLVALFARGWHRQYPWFTAYVMLTMVSDLFLALARGRWPYVYYFGYWATMAASIALTIAVLYEVAQHARHPFELWRKLVAALVWTVVALSIVQSVMDLRTSTAHMDVITSFLLLADRNLRIVVCALGVFILVLRKRLGLSWRDLPVGIVAGFALFSYVHLAVATTLTHQTIFHRSTLAAINSGAYDLAALIWLGYAILSPKFVGGSPGTTPPRRSWPGGRGYFFRGPSMERGAGISRFELRLLPPHIRTARSVGRPGNLPRHGIRYAAPLLVFLSAVTMRITAFALFLSCAIGMSFAFDDSSSPSKSPASPAKPSVIEGGNGVTLSPPPPTEAKPVTETINGQTITDPYRWLEEQQSPATREWIAAQMKYTEEYLSQVKLRPEIAKRLSELVRVETYSIPFEAGGKYFFTKRLPEENQASIYMRKGLTGADERLIDATRLSADQQTNVAIVDVSKDGSLLLYAVREGGADEESVHMLDVNTGKEAADVLPKARYLGVSLTPDKQAIYYSKFEGKLTEVYLHRMGTSVADDQKIFGGSFNGETFGAMELISVNVSENGRYLIIDVNHGVPPKRVDVYVKDLRSADAPIKPIIHGIDSRFVPVNYDDDLYVLTDYQADNFRIIRIKLSDPAPEHWQTIVPESKDPMEQFSIVGGKLFATGLHDVVTQTRIFDLDGKQTGNITYPTLGAASTVFGRQNSKDGFYNFQSFNIPPTIYHYNVASGKTEVFARPKVPFNSDEYEVRQIFYTSKDGTRVPMFISSKKGAKRDGATPTLMSAYGGFLASLTPLWNPEYAWWMEQGGFYAQPNLRGGGEYGEAWHKAGMFEKKQNVFDDFFAAAQYLIDNQYTSPAHLAIRGRSNGGLLMGAAMTQHPEMFGAIWCGYPLLDMLRYQNFLIGRWWTSEYGSAENAQQFPYLLKYSPYHNVKAGTKYPAIMFNSGDSDTRVDPLHARKMTALMQADTGSDRPILLHYQLKAGHSAGVSITQLVNDNADELAFLWNEVSGSQTGSK